MKLLTQEVRKALPALYSQEEVSDPMVPIKFFYPAGSATWWIIEGSPEGFDFLMFGLCDLGCPELGYVAMSELQNFKGRFGLGIERDLYWRPKHLSEVKAMVGLS